MKFVPETIENYCIAHSQEIPEYLHELERATHLRTLAPQMISGKLLGRYLSFISNLMKPTCIVEIGTFTGYSALCLAEGLAENGVVHTFEVNDELLPTIEEFKQKSPFADQINVHIGPAEELFPTMSIVPDLAFLDAGKSQYLAHYEMLVERMKSGSLIMVDNVLWSGKVTKPSQDTDTLGLQKFNQAVLFDDRCTPIMLPLRDGLTMLRVS